MSDTTITSANSVVTMSVAGLFTAPVQLQGYSADKAWSTDQVDLAEVQMGVDGRMTAGYTPMPVKQNFSLQADSPSKTFFTTIVNATKAARDVYYINGTISLPATGESFTCRKGVLQNFKALPDANKVLQPMEFSITWEAIQPTLL